MRNLCPSASNGCAAACLNLSGRGRFHGVQQARLERTKLFVQHRKDYRHQLFREVCSFDEHCLRKGMKAAVRLNGTSDVKWEKILGYDFFEFFDDIEFYDYTKIHKRMLDYCHGHLPPNYHLTFSRSESNHDQCIEVLESGGNVAVVFRKELPEEWEDFPVFNADETDLRFLDPRGVAGLKAKGPAKKDESGFVV